ncbi:hypothetical protein E3N88_35935 [Mikania micrantha]|uniref:Uncharacterized protein n=1 Tax=Mikania micrantha TaxID=192012 RepID=A0A5N6M2C4_9ASTR|nr:hypothetical protein E3N88_35935 [Mikania micrantha]
MVVVMEISDAYRSNSFDDVVVLDGETRSRCLNDVLMPDRDQGAAYLMVDVYQNESLIKDVAIVLKANEEIKKQWNEERDELIKTAKDRHEDFNLRIVCLNLNIFSVNLLEPLASSQARFSDSEDLKFALRFGKSGIWCNRWDRLQMGEVVSTIPTIGFNVETVQYNNIKFQVWDLGIYFRPYWRCYFPNTQAVIYVVDSSDTDRLVIAKEEFHAILEEEELKGAVVLIFANKQDLSGALDDAAVTETLELHKIKNRQWSIFKSSAIKGEGLFEGLDW